MNAEPNTSTGFVEDADATGAAGAAGAMRSWRYAYDARGLLVGTSDARGCGVNLHYDAGARLVAKDYSPCRLEHAEYTLPDLQTGDGTELFQTFDGFGRVSSKRDRGASTVPTYDARGRVTHVARQIAKPGEVAAKLAERYAPRGYETATTFDLLDRPLRQTSGATMPELLARDPETGELGSAVTYHYSRRGVLARMAGSYGTLLKKQSVDVDGFVTESVFGDMANGDAVETTALRLPDARRLLARYSLFHTAPEGRDAELSAWLEGAPAATTRQLRLAASVYTYDRAGEITDIADQRTASEWPAGAKPVQRGFRYDDFHRLIGVTYDHGGDVQEPLFKPERTTRANAYVPGAATSGSRVREQTVAYDWKGNTTQTNDDASAFFERSLGDITNGDLKPHQFVSATQGGATASASYDAAGNLTSLRVERAECAEAGRCNHVFEYEWDEIGNLSRARRWDARDAGGVPAVDFAYGYGGVARVLKSVTIAGETRHTADVFGSLRLKSVEWDGQDYARTADSEEAYLGGLAHVRVARQDVAGSQSGRRHVLLGLGDELGSSSVVVDKASGELAQSTQYQAYGGTDADYRPERWGAHREDYRFTGKEDDAEVGITYFGVRYYHAVLGRWMSADPLTVHGAAADLNPYAYVRGSPTNLVDPKGLQEDPNPIPCGSCQIVPPPPPPGGTGRGDPPPPPPTPPPPEDPAARAARVKAGWQVEWRAGQAAVQTPSMGVSTRQQRDGARWDAAKAGMALAVLSPMAMSARLGTYAPEPVMRQMARVVADLLDTAVGGVEAQITAIEGSGVITSADVRENVAAGGHVVTTVSVRPARDVRSRASDVPFTGRKRTQLLELQERPKR